MTSFSVLLRRMLTVSLALVAVVTTASASSNFAQQDSNGILERNDRNGKVALVYDGDGACADGCWQAAALMAERQGFKVRFINADTFSEDKFQDAVLWIQPGGMSTTVAKLMSHKQKNRLRKFVAAGGGYVGFCAGAFVASSGIRKSENVLYPVETFNLVPMLTDSYEEVEGPAAILTFNWLGRSRQLYWEGGPFFEGTAPEGVEVISYYPNGQIAAVRNMYGKGKVFVVGPHPEAPDDWRQYFKIRDSDGLDYEFADQMIQWVTN